MASEPVQGEIYIFYLGLTDVLNPDEFVSNPTIAAGDFQVSTDGSAYINLSTLPIVDPANSITVKVTVSAAEMAGEKVNIKAIDAAGSEWGQSLVAFDVPTGSTETLLDLTEGDRVETATRLIINKKNTQDAPVLKEVGCQSPSMRSWISVTLAPLDCTIS